MKKYLKEIIIILIQLIVFYVYPCYAIKIDPMGMVIIIILATFILSMVIGCISKEKVKYIYPIATSILFIPSVFIHYNESALIHSVWYLGVSSIGLLIGSVIYKLTSKK